MLSQIRAGALSDPPCSLPALSNLRGLLCVVAIFRTRAKRNSTMPVHRTDLTCQSLSWRSHPHPSHYLGPCLGNLVTLTLYCLCLPPQLQEFINWRRESCIKFLERFQYNCSLTVMNKEVLHCLTTQIDHDIRPSIRKYFIIVLLRGAVLFHGSFRHWKIAPIRVISKYFSSVHSADPNAFRNQQLYSGNASGQGHHRLPVSSNLCIIEISERDSSEM